MKARYLLDANVLVYTLDSRELEKRERAKEVLRRTALMGSGVLPVQALSEFSNVCLRKLRPTLAPEEVRLEVERLTLAFPVLPLTPLVVSEVLRGVQEHSFSYYDAQVWAAARLGQVAGILSEDFNTGATIEGVQFVDPSDSAFDVTILG